MGAVDTDTDAVDAVSMKRRSDVSRRKSVAVDTDTVDTDEDAVSMKRRSDVSMRKRVAVDTDTDVVDAVSMKRRSDVSMKKSVAVDTDTVDTDAVAVSMQKRKSHFSKTSNCKEEPAEFSGESSDPPTAASVDFFYIDNQHSGFTWQNLNFISGVKNHV